jgi:hypothetical protein
MQEGDFTCLFSSFASAMHYVGLEDVAAVVAADAAKYSANSEEGTNNWKALLKIMETKCGWLEPRKLYGSGFEILEDISEYPTLVALEAEDGGTQHAITVVGKIIFDSNCARGLPLTKDSLDYCCSSDEVVGAYKKVYKGYRFLEPEGKKKKVWRKLKEKHHIDFFLEEDQDS